MTPIAQRRAIALANERARQTARKVAHMIAEEDFGGHFDIAKWQADEARKERDHLIREMSE